jgi:hypothetical protein
VIQFSATVVGAREIAARWLAKVATVDAEVEVTLSRDAATLLSQIQSRAPVDTGRYRASWHVEGGKGQRIVSTSEPYGRRLEFGFYGTDSLGRDYNQAPQPHVNPAADAIEDEFVRHLADDATRGL